MRLTWPMLSAGLLLGLGYGSASAQLHPPMPYHPTPATPIQTAPHAYPLHGHNASGTPCPPPAVQPVPQPQPVTPAPVTPVKPEPQPQPPAPAPAPPAPQPEQPLTPEPPAAPVDLAPPPTDAFAQAPAAGTAAPAAFNPTMFGDIIGPRVRRTVTGPNGVTFNAFIPLAARGAFKIAENESPRPLDRVYFNYNYFNRVNLGVADPGFGSVDLHREVIGFEKTFLNGDASFGMRLPILQLDGDGSVDADGFGDISIILKFALINDRQTGDVLSTGLVVTAPTAEDDLFPGIGPDIHPTLLQPYVGYILNANNCYVHGFTSVVVPTDSEDATLLFNDIGIGYWLYRNDGCSGDPFIASIVPTIEAHVTTPLNHRGLDHPSAVGVPDIVTITTGVTIGFGRGCTFGAAMGVPVTGPRPYDIEGLAHLNFFF